MRSVIAVAAGLMFLAGSNAQEKSAELPGTAQLQNTGAPIRVDFQCSDEDLRLTGLDCTAEHPCPTYLELSAAESAGDRIFLAGNIHTASTTLCTILLASEDGGKNWREPHDRIRAGILEQIQFFDFGTGWVGGQLIGARPHDPFLLLTTDGGRTWRRRPVVEESRIGAIERFWFDSRESGTVWLDRSQSGERDSRYERYESMTGGESWMLREVSSRPILQEQQRVGQASTGWRLRPHAATSSYRVERRGGDGWQSIASFLIHVGECGPPEKPLPEPIAEPPEPSPGTSEEPSPSPPKPPNRPPSLKRKPQ
jgi:hypothetical protein